MILSGNAVVRRPGRRNVTLGPGDFFGEMALLDGAPRTATVEAANEVEVMQIPRSGFRKMLAVRRQGGVRRCSRRWPARLRATQASPTA